MDPTNKNRGRGRLLRCFKPVSGGDDDELADSDSASAPSSGDEIGGGRRKKRARRSLYAAAKAVLFKTSLLKKLRDDQNPRQDFNRLSKKFVKSMKNFSYKACWEPGEINLRSDSNSSSLLSSSSTGSSSSTSISSSSSSPSSSENSRSESHRIRRPDSLDFGRSTTSTNKQKPIMKRDCARKSCAHKCNLSILEMSLFLVCLGALVFWGKVFAIVTCTSTWLIFAPGRRGHRLRKVGLKINDDAI